MSEVLSKSRPIIMKDSNLAALKCFIFLVNSITFWVVLFIKWLLLIDIQIYAVGYNPRENKGEK